MACLDGVTRGTFARVLITSAFVHVATSSLGIGGQVAPVALRMSRFAEASRYAKTNNPGDR